MSTTLRLPEPIVVLGGGGFIGASLVKRLVSDGYMNVKAVSRAFPDFRFKLLEGSWLAYCDLRDPEAVDRIIRGAGTVFHLAADMGGVGYMHSSADQPASTDNGRMTANVLSACERFQVPRVFFASSACAYPTEFQHGDPAPKLHEYMLRIPGTPDALYGVEKLHAMELASRLPAARVGVLFTIYGPYQEHEGIRMKFPPAVATKAITARETGVLEMWGDGSQLRCYQYIDDAIEKIIRITASETYHGPVNVGHSGAISCLDVAKMCLSIVGADAEIVLSDDHPTGVMSRDCDNTKFNRLYGRMNELPYEEGFIKLIDWLDSL